MAYWNHVIKKEFEKAYDYEYPLAKMTLTRYIAQRANPLLGYKSFELKSITKRDEDTADVELEVVPAVKVPGTRAFEHAMTITERWVKVKDVWHHISKKSMDGLTHEREKGGDVQH